MPWDTYPICGLYEPGAVHVVGVVCEAIHGAGDLVGTAGVHIHGAGARLIRVVRGLVLLQVCNRRHTTMGVNGQLEQLIRKPCPKKGKTGE